MKAAAKAVMNEPGRAFTAPSLPRVCDAPAPLTTAPRITKMEHRIAAVPNLTMRVPTAVPNTLAASLAPRDQPKNRPLQRKIRTAISMSLGVPADHMARLIA